MDEWNTRQHGGSGLTQRVRDSRISAQRSRGSRPSRSSRSGCRSASSPICGNSICQDRRFLYRHMPTLENYFHYRNLDVSTLKELAARWSPKSGSSRRAARTWRWTTFASPSVSCALPRAFYQVLIRAPVPAPSQQARSHTGLRCSCGSEPARDGIRPAAGDGTEVDSTAPPFGAQTI